MKNFDTARNQLIEQANQDRFEYIQQQKEIYRAEKLKLGEFTTHFADMVAEENQRLKADVKKEHETRLAKQHITKVYAKEVKKPKIDD